MSDWWCDGTQPIFDLKSQVRSWNSPKKIPRSGFVFCSCDNPRPCATTRALVLRCYRDWYFFGRVEVATVSVTCVGSICTIFIYPGVCFRQTQTSGLTVKPDGARCICTSLFQMALQRDYFSKLDSTAVCRIWLYWGAGTMMGLR